jgi:hypothetical protein
MFTMLSVTLLMPAYDIKEQMLMLHKHDFMGVDNRQQFFCTLDRPIRDISAAHQLMFRQADLALWLYR